MSHTPSIIVMQDLIMLLTEDNVGRSWINAKNW